MNYIQKDPGAPCSLTEALEYLQVDVLEQLMDKDTANHRQPPKNKPHNITVVAMEGCHSFVILDWARPLKDDMVSGTCGAGKLLTHIYDNKVLIRRKTCELLSISDLAPWINSNASPSVPTWVLTWEESAPVFMFSSVHGK